MWFFPTRKRPAWCQRLLNACIDTGMTSPGLVVIDGKRTDYPDLRYRHVHNISIVATEEHLEFCGVLRWIFRNYPYESFYGFICDDGIPRTPGWDKELEKTAGSWHLACSNDLLHECGRLTYGVFGGELVRAVGFLSPPGFIHLYIDNVWEYLDRALGIMRERSDVVIEEMHFSNGKAPMDQTYERIYQGKPYGELDRAAFAAWIADITTIQMINRVRGLLEQRRLVNW